ncbi:MAG: hypothetical protein JXA97_13230 [Anaerolineales bacterium]|nr:hypothetical protein [Anaerolineales bacterium]
MNARRVLVKVGIHRALLLHVEGASDQEGIDDSVRGGGNQGVKDFFYTV